MELRPARQLAVFRRLAGCAVDATKNSLRFAPLATGLLFCEEERFGIGSDLTSGGIRRGGNCPSNGSLGWPSIWRTLGSSAMLGSGGGGSDIARPLGPVDCRGVKCPSIVVCSFFTFRLRFFVAGTAACGPSARGGRGRGGRGGRGAADAAGAAAAGAAELPTTVD